MLLFLLGMAILVIGYFTYGRFVEKILEPDDRPTPCRTCSDGVDFVRLPHWKNMLIQLLNIAGVGPVIGVILGIKFGAIAFLIIPVGNIIGGAVHDFVGGMMSLRHNGANLPELIRMNTGKAFYWIFSAFMIFLLLLVVAVFINIPARLIDGFWPSTALFWTAVVAIFLYYIAATLFPVDKIIGSIYPLFGALLILGTFAIFAVLMFHAAGNPALLSESEAFRANMLTPANNSPILPMLFVTIACGILSGFHATQSPIIARTMEHEKQAKSSYYGMMVLEGVIGMIWAAAGLAIYNLFPELMQENPTNVLSKITTHFLGSWVGAVTVISVIILAVTSGDTAMRSLRLSLAEMFRIQQKPIRNRFLLCLPLIAVVEPERPDLQPALGLLRMGQSGARKLHADGRHSLAAAEPQAGVDHRRAGRVHDLHRRDLYPLDLAGTRRTARQAAARFRARAADSVHHRNPVRMHHDRLEHLVRAETLPVIHSAHLSREGCPPRHMRRSENHPRRPGRRG